MMGVGFCGATFPLAIILIRRGTESQPLHDRDESRRAGLGLAEARSEVRQPGPVGIARVIWAEVKVCTRRRGPRLCAGA